MSELCLSGSRLFAAIPSIRSGRAAEVAAMFGIDRVTADASQSAPAVDRKTLRQLLPGPHQIVLLTGPSGAGKTSLLSAVRKLERRQRKWIRLSDASLPNVPLVDCFGGDARMDQVLAALSRVGLAEAWTYLRTPLELSEGQRWRLRLAMAFHGARIRQDPSRLSTLLIDEFAAVLDRVTASIVARALRRIVSEDAASLSAIVATSHEDLIDALRPDLLVRCDFVSASIESSPEPEASQSRPGSRRSHARR
jgi:ABC-type ATPase with predicted acetyltransferase domain